MATSIYLVSAGATVAILAAVVMFVRNGLPWRRGTPSREVGTGFAPALPGSTPGGALSTITRDPATWVLGFFLLVVLAVGTTVLALSGGGIAIVFGFIVAGLVGFLTLGVYSMGRSHGHPFSHAVAEAVITLGGVTLVATMVWLVYTDGKLF